jgi:hypothetical protein
MKKFKEFKSFKHTIQNNEYDYGAQNQMKKTKIKSPSLALGGHDRPFYKSILRSRNPWTKRRYGNEH